VSKNRARGPLDPIYDRLSPVISKLEPWLFVAAFLVAMILVGTIESGGLK
jgi:hypothetical protein